MSEKTKGSWGGWRGGGRPRSKLEIQTGKELFGKLAAQAEKWEVAPEEAALQILTGYFEAPLYAEALPRPAQRKRGRTNPAADSVPVELPEGSPPYVLHIKHADGTEAASMCAHARSLRAKVIHARSIGDTWEAFGALDLGKMERDKPEQAEHLRRLLERAG